MFEHFKRYPWVFELYYYRDVDDVVSSLVERIIRPAEIRIEKSKQKQGLSGGESQYGDSAEARRFFDG